MKELEEMEEDEGKDSDALLEGLKDVRSLHKASEM